MNYQYVKAGLICSILMLSAQTWADCSLKINDQLTESDRFIRTSIVLNSTGAVLEDGQPMLLTSGLALELKNLDGKLQAVGAEFKANIQKSCFSDIRAVNESIEQLKAKSSFENQNKLNDERRKLGLAYKTCFDLIANSLPKTQWNRDLRLQGALNATELQTYNDLTVGWAGETKVTIVSPHFPSGAMIGGNHIGVDKEKLSAVANSLLAVDSLQLGKTITSVRIDLNESGFWSHSVGQMIEELDIPLPAAAASGFSYRGDLNVNGSRMDGALRMRTPDRIRMDLFCD